MLFPHHLTHLTTSSPMEAVQSAIQQVSHIQDDVTAAVLPSTEQRECLARLTHTQQRIAALQRLSPQLWELSTAAGAAAAGGNEQQAQQQLQPGARDVAALRRQAQRAAAALQQQVLAAVSAQPQPALTWGPNPTQGQQSIGPASEAAWLLVLQRACAAAPSLRLHLFREGSQYLCSGHSPPRHMSYCKYADEVRVVCAGVFVASIGLAAPGRLQAVRVCIDSADKAASISPWSTPKHQVFRRINLLAVKAMQHFQHLQAARTLLEVSPGAGQSGSSSTAAADGAAAPATGSSSRTAEGLALECLLLWLAAYDDLFSRPCDVSGKVVAWAPASNVPLPPVVRPYWLSLEELTAAASDKAARRAYHAHLAPWPSPAEGAAALDHPCDEEVGASTEGAADAGMDGVTQQPPLLGATFTDDELRAQLQHIVGDVW